MTKFGLGIATALVPLVMGMSMNAQAQQSDMSFFISSVGSGKGADYGGLDGADKHCQTLATAVGAGNRTWRAYLSTQGPGAVNARDRIGSGPWQNVKGVVIAHNVAELHGDNNLNKQTALTEKGEVNNGRGDTPNKHDILTGSQPDGTAFADAADHTCGNWTKSGEGAAQLGHHDRLGLKDDAPAHSWNSAHPSQGCSDAKLAATGSAGLLYCFAAK
ncbi:MAG: lectin [Rhodocyclales bacterium]|nr:lectin [Rhodocyclales bacterium]MDB5887613.1 lectin [Rhodocyclales bacterium]